MPASAEAAPRVLCGARLWPMPANEEGPAFGAAILAAVAGGAFPSVPAAVEKLCRVKETVLPEEPLVKAYEEGYETFRLLYPALKKVFEK